MSEWTARFSEYALERQDHSVYSQFLVGTVAAGIAYAVPVGGVILAHCGHLFTDHGCHNVSKVVLYLSPLPALSLYAFFLANQLVLTFGARYLRSLEDEFGSKPSSGYPTPRGFTKIVEAVYGPDAGLLRVFGVVGQGGALLLVLAFTICSIGAAPWGMAWWVLSGAALGVFLSILFGLSLYAIRTIIQIETGKR